MKDNSKILFYIDKKQRYFNNTEKMHCIRCSSNNVSFKKKWQPMPYSYKEYDLISNVICKNCNHTFMDDEWNK